MKRTSLFGVIIVSLCLTGSVWAQVPQIINYQGRVTVAGTNFTGAGQFKFALVNATGSTNYWSNTGAATGEPSATVSLVVSNGLYAVLLGDTNVAGMTAPIAPAVFNNADVRVRVWFNDGVSGFQLLTPDRRLGAVGYAVLAGNVPDGVITSNKLAVAAVTTAAIANNAVSNAKLANSAVTVTAGSGLSGGGAVSLGGGVTLNNSGVLGVSGSGNIASSGGQNPQISFTGILPTGSGGTGIGTAPSSAGQYLRASGAGAWAVGGIQGSDIPSLSGSYVDLSSAQTIGGAKTFSSPINSSISGNAAGFTGSLAGDVTGTQGATTVARLQGRNVASTAPTDGQALKYSASLTRWEPGTVAGTPDPNADLVARRLNIGMGNVLSGTLATAAGGSNNTVSGGFSAVGGGYQNTAGSGNGATVGGGVKNVASGDNATVAGGSENTAKTDWTTVGGGWANAAVGGSATVAGGSTNTASGAYSAVAGGFSNRADGFSAAVGGGFRNTASNQYATVGGGYGNYAIGAGAFVGGGGWNGSIGGGNLAGAPASTVGGGIGNTASGYYSTVGGGSGNIASNEYTTVGGGNGNTAGGMYSTVGGGVGNTASGNQSTLGGGSYNYATADYSTVAGGGQNFAMGFASFAGGGLQNSANRDYSFVAGRRAKALHDGAFVWADSADADFTSTTNNQFNVRANGGVFLQGSGGGGAPQLTLLQAANDFCRLRLGTSGYPSWDISSQPSATPELRFWNGSANKMWLDYNGNLTITGTYNPPSDRNLKTNFADVNARTVLERLAAVPIQTWTYRTDDSAARHIGPVAQDFHAAFGVGADDKHISTVDADGVALAAIQGLYEVVKDKDARIAELEDRLKQLETQMQQLVNLGGK